MRFPLSPFSPRKTTIQMGQEAPMEVEVDGREQAERVVHWLKRKRQSESEEAQRARQRRQRRQRQLALATLVALGGLGLSASRRLADYQSVSVTAVTGTPLVRTEEGEKPAKPGMRLRLTPGLAFRTGGDATLALRSRGVSLLVRQGSVLKVSTAHYTHGAIRRLQLAQGSAVVQVDSLHRDASFELTTGTTRVFCRPSLASVRALSQGGSVVAVREGVVRVQQGERRVMLPAGRQLTLPQASVPLSDEVGGILKRAGEALRPPASEALSDQLQGIVEDTLLPFWEPAFELVFHFPTLIADVRAKLLARGALQAIATALPVGEGPPARLSPRLEELPLPAETRKSLLKSLDRERIWLYRRLETNDKYEFYARARDSRKTVFLVRNGQVSTPKNEDIPLELL